jgi:hypothetical protein
LLRKSVFANALSDLVTIYPVVASNRTHDSVCLHTSHSNKGHTFVRPTAAINPFEGTVVYVSSLYTRTASMCLDTAIYVFASPESSQLFNPFEGKNKSVRKKVQSVISSPTSYIFKMTTIYISMSLVYLASLLRCIYILQSPRILPYCGAFDTLSIASQVSCADVC